MAVNRSRSRARPSGVAQAWTPARRGAALIAWLDADPAYVTLATGSVAAWLDRGGGGKNFAQGSAPNRFGYSASDAAYGGRPVLLGTGSSYLDAAGAWSLSQPTTLYAVCETGNSADWKTIVDDIGVSPRTVLRADPTEMASMYAGSANITSATLFNTPSIVCAVFNGASSALYVRSTTAAVTGNPGTQDIGTPRIGYAAQGTTPYPIAADGKIAELIWISGADDATKRAQMMTYLKSRYGLAVTGL